MESKISVDNNKTEVTVSNGEGDFFIYVSLKTNDKTLDIQQLRSELKDIVIFLEKKYIKRTIASKWLEWISSRFE
jgi:hypothetical protein